MTLLVVIILIVLLLGWLGRLGKIGSEMRKSAASVSSKPEDQKPFSYTIGFNLSQRKRTDDEGMKGPVVENACDFSGLKGFLPDDKIDKIIRNVEYMIDRHGSDSFFIIEQVLNIAADDFVSNHGSLLLGDELQLDLSAQMSVPDGRFIPIYFKADKQLVRHMLIWEKDEVCHKLDTMKITGAFIGDMTVYADKSWRDESKSIIVFYDDDDDDEDDEEDDDMPAPPSSSETFASLLLVLQLMKQRIRIQK